MATVPLAPQTFTIPNTGGTTIAANNIGGAGVQVIGADQSRKSITFINPNIVGQINLLVYQMTDGNGAALAPSFASPGGGVPVVPGGIITFSGDCQGAWGAVAQSGNTNGITIIPSRS